MGRGGQAEGPPPAVALFEVDPRRGVEAAPAAPATTPVATADGDVAPLLAKPDAVVAAAPTHPGLLSWKSFDAPDGERVTIVEFVDEEAYRAWVREPAHVAAKARRLEVYEELSTTVGAVTEPVRRWAAPS